MQFRLLGPVDVVDADRPLGITARRERAVLLRLLMEPGRPVGPERLIDDVWGDDAPVDSRGSLRVLVARLRRRLDRGDEPRILTGPAGYELRLSVDDEVDAARFDSLVARAREELSAGDAPAAGATLRAALALWRGTAMGDLADLDFARPEAVRLDEARLAALEARIDADLRCGRHGELTGELEALCLAHPLREGLWAHRMVALYRSGRQTEALRVYQELRRVLADEVGLEPTPALVRLEATLVAGELPDLTAAPPPATPTGHSPADGGALFVGREEELASLRATWDEAATGTRRVVLLHGEPGAGKTTLADRFGDRLRHDGATVLVGHFDEEMLLPYQGFVEAILQLRSPGDPDHPSGWAALAHLVPGGGPDPAADLGGHGAAELERYRVLAAIEGLLEKAATSGPLLLVLDDLHWADPPSLLLLKQLTRARNPAPLMIVATYRDTALHDGHPLAAAVGQLHRSRNVADLRVGQLGLTDVAHLVAARLGSDEVEAEAIAQAIVQRTDGHALFSEALVDAMADPHRDQVTRQALDVPTTVREFVATSTSRLSQPARTMLAVGAVHGTTFPLASALATSGLDASAGVDGLEECSRSGFIQDAGGPGALRFSHNLVRDVVYANLPPVRRAHLHQVVADALARSERGPAVSHADIARHLALAPTSPSNLRRRVDHERSAGEDAMRKLAFEAAATHFGHALDAATQLGADGRERATLLLLAAKPLLLTGHPGQATTLCEEAIALAGDDDPALRARAALVLEEASWTGYGFTAPATAARVAAHLRGALAAIEPASGDDDGALAAELLARLPRVLHFGTSPDDRVPLAEAGLRRAEVSGLPRLRGAALEGLRWALWGSTDVERLAEVSERICVEADDAGDRALAVRGHVWRYLSRLDRGDLLGVREAITALRTLGESLPEPLALWYPEVADTTLSLLAGRVDDAERSALNAFAVARRFDLGWAVETFGIQLQQIRREQARLAELEEATLAAAASHDGEPVWQIAVADLHLQLGRTDAAAGMLGELLPVLPGLPRDLTRLAALTLAADLAADLEDETAAAELYPVLLPYADQVAVVGPGVVCLGSASRHLGALAGLLGMWEVADLHLDAALERNLELDAAPWVARTHLARAAARARQGQAAPAAACLADARSLAARLELPQLLAACDRVAPTAR